MTTPTLSAIPNIHVAIGSAKSDTIKLVHKFIFGTDEVRKNRQNLREFAGFTFQPNDAEFAEKVEAVITDFSKIQLIRIANFFQLDTTDTSEKDITQIILSSLCDLNSFRDTFVANSDSDTEILSSALSTNSHQNTPASSATTSVTVSIASSAPIYSHAHLPSTSVNNYFTQPAAPYLSIGMNSALPTFSLPNSLPYPHQTTNFHNDFAGTSSRTNIAFGDIENILPTFNGAAHENIDSWLTRFENIASSFDLSERQKFLFVQRAVGGLAKLHLRSEVSALTYVDIKQSLLSEFGQKVTAACVHDLLRSRRCRQHESPFEYFLVMKEIASRGSLDDASLLHYIIAGINDTPHNKTLLYGASSLSEFKEKLQIYEAICNDVSKQAPKPKPSFTPRAVDQKRAPQQSSIRCFNCGALGHKSSSCFNKHRGIKCFNCNFYGHKSNVCSSPRASTGKTTSQGTSPSTNPTNRNDEHVGMLTETHPPEHMPEYVTISHLTA